MKDTLALRISVGKASRRSPVICLQWPTGAGTEMPVGTGTSCGCQLQIDLKQISIANTCTSRYTGKIKRIERQCITTDLDWTLCLRYPNTRANRISPINIYYVLAMVAHLARWLTSTNQDCDKSVFASAGFHSWPNTLKWDALSGDYGQNFLGLALGHTTYLVEQQDGGLIAYSGNTKYLPSGVVEVEPRDAVRRRVFIGPLRLKVEISAGAIPSFTYNSSSQSIALQLVTKVPVEISRNSAAAQSTVIWLSAPAADSGATNYRVVHAKARVRDGTLITLARNTTTTVTIMTI